MNIVIEKNKKILNDTYYNYLYQSSERLNYIYKKVLNICSKKEQDTRCFGDWLYTLFINKCIM